MPSLDRADLHLHYESHGQGFPLLAFAPGGMRSSTALWSRAAYDPRVALSDQLRVITMDQRNAGQSSAPVRAEDGWHTYAEDHVALLDHLGIERCHLLGNCIGGSFCLALMQAAPERIASAVLQQPIGCDGHNRQLFYDMFDGWARELSAQRPELRSEDLSKFCERMYGGDFVFSASRDFVRGCQTPLLVLMGNDPYHPSVTSREIVELAPNAELVERWKEPERVDETVQRVRAFFRGHG